MSIILFHSISVPDASMHGLHVYLLTTYTDTCAMLSRTIGTNIKYNNPSPNVWTGKGEIYMIYFYSGRPGSGKSLHCAKMIDQYHRKGKNVICNFEVNENFWKHKRCKKNKFLKDYGIIQELTNEQLTIDFLMDFANKNHKRNKRGQIIENRPC